MYEGDENDDFRSPMGEEPTSGHGTRELGRETPHYPSESMTLECATPRCKALRRREGGKDLDAPPLIPEIISPSIFPPIPDR